MKIVVNRCYGGFGLSEEAMRRYAEIKGMTLYPEKDDRFEFVTYFTVPPEQRLQHLTTNEFYALSDAEQEAYNTRWAQQTLHPLSVPRDDPALAQVVEEVGVNAGGDYSKLEVVDIPDGVEWEIEEYDGREWVSEKHRTW